MNEYDKTVFAVNLAALAYPTLIAAAATAMVFYVPVMAIQALANMAPRANQEDQ